MPGLGEDEPRRHQAREPHGRVTICRWSLAERGRWSCPPEPAAEHFAFVVLGTTLDRVMLEGEQSVSSHEELQRAADDAATVSLAAYAAR